VRGVAALTVLITLACSGNEQAPADERADVERLQAALTEDPAQLVLDEVDEAVDHDRPVIAADLLDDAAIPAVRRHITTVQGLEMHTSAGQSYRSRAARLLRARLHALELWRDALSRGVGFEDDQLLEALHATGEAEHDIAAFHAELATIRPLDTAGAPSSEVREQVAEDLPALAPPSSGAGDDTTTEPAAPDPTAADPIDGREDPTATPPPEPPALEDHHAIVPRHP
jgi:hypothetical protein